MTKKIETVARACAVLLAGLMLIATVIKAQGCRSKEKMLPATKAGGFIEPQAQPPQPAQQLPVPAAVVDAGADVSPDAADDAGRDQGPFDSLRESPSDHMFPATKSGGFEFQPRNRGNGLGLHPREPGSGFEGLLRPQQQAPESQ